MNNCFICIDTGTTNTRVWLTVGTEVRTQARASVGVRDTARTGSLDSLHTALRELISQVRTAAPEHSPKAVLAAGMITSPLGLADIPHVAAPASLQDLATHTQRQHFDNITDLPVLLVPGVRSGPLHCTVENIGDADVMRGEETLCLGLSALGVLPPDSTLFNLGSHWKVIRLDEQARIAASLTSLTGELIHATQTQTILASSVPPGKPEQIDSDWVRAGMSTQRQSGTSRALFCVRLLEQRAEATPEQRLSFLLGVYLAADLAALLEGGWLQTGKPVVLTGSGAVAQGWQMVLADLAIPTRILSEAEVEQGFLTGLLRIAATLLH